MASDKLTKILSAKLDEAVEELASELAGSSVADVVAAVIRRDMGANDYGFSAGYGREASTFNDWFCSLPGIAEQIDGMLKRFLSSEHQEKGRLKGMKLALDRFHVIPPDSYYRRDVLRPVHEIFVEYARIRAREDAKAIYEAARDATLQRIEAKKSTTEVTKKSPPKRKKSCPNTDDVVQDS